MSNDDHQHDHHGRDDPNPEELIREMARRLAETPVRDLLLQTMATFADLAGVRLGYGPEGPARRELPQARLAIEALRALIGVVENEMGAAQARPFREPLAQLQMLYAREVESDAAAPAEAGTDATGSAAGVWTPESEAGGGGSSRIWTPGSS